MNCRDPARDWSRSSFVNRSLGRLTGAWSGITRMIKSGRGGYTTGFSRPAR
jgi:hypothetical protein